MSGRDPAGDFKDVMMKAQAAMLEAMQKAAGPGQGGKPQAVDPASMEKMLKAQKSVQEAMQEAMQDAMEKGLKNDPEGFANAMKAMQEGAENRKSEEEIYKRLKNRSGGRPLEDLRETVDAYASIKSEAGQKILRRYRGMNESEASDFKLRAITSKAARDWHKENPNESRDPTPAEAYRPMMMIGLNPSLVELAIVEYEPERLRLEKSNTQALVRENAKSRTPAFDALSPEQKLAVEWQVRQNYANAHEIMKDKDPTTTWKRAYNYDLFPKILSIHGIKEDRLIEDLRALQEGIPFSRDSSVAGNSRMLGLYKKFVKDIETKDLESSAPVAKKWQERELEQIATHVSLLNMAVHDFGLQQQNEKAVKNNLPVKDKYRTGREKIMYEITQEGVLAREGCKWAEDGSLTEANPSALCSHTPAGAPRLMSNNR